MGDRHFATSHDAVVGVYSLGGRAKNKKTSRMPFRVADQRAFHCHRVLAGSVKRVAASNFITSPPTSTHFALIEKAKQLLSRRPLSRRQPETVMCAGRGSGKTDIARNVLVMGSYMSPLLPRHDGYMAGLISLPA